ncbi:MAG: DUF1045 domain-containing protein [Bradyrhizobiaceae bacterium]|nr:MAG: DUF1045 domain-containing protein [Bradyrhizobiaceae bacterium]
MPTYPRYAIYFVPPAESDFYRFGAHLLGYDAFSGEALSFPDGIESQIDNWQAITADPLKYGFHATLKAPFSLADGQTEARLLDEVRKFANMPRAIPLIAPVIRAIGSFIAIVPQTLSPDLQQLAADCVTAFEAFRAPLTEHDRARRNLSTLTDKQIALLDRWGYPYVFDEFRFHMTLTGSLPAGRIEPVAGILRARFAAIATSTLSIGRIALMRQSEAASRFTVVSHEVLKSLDQTPAK